ncbi:MAG: Domain of unknown function / Efflux ABC transporter, permease protein, partial [uncultured Gemmatimonadetes bacterium]
DGAHPLVLEGAGGAVLDVRVPDPDGGGAGDRLPRTAGAEGGGGGGAGERGGALPPRAAGRAGGGRARAGARGGREGAANRRGGGGARGDRRRRLPLRSGTRGEPGSAAAGRRRAAAGRRWLPSRAHARRRRAEAGGALHRLGDPRACRAQPDEHRDVGAGLRAGADEAEEAAQAPRIHPHAPRRLPHGADGGARLLPAAGGAAAAAVRVAGVRGEAAGVHAAAVGARLPGGAHLRGDRAAGGVARAHHRGGERGAERGDAPHVRALGRILLVRAVPGGAAACHPGAPAHRPQRRIARGVQRGAGNRRGRAGRGHPAGVDRRVIRACATRVPLAV